MRMPTLLTRMGIFSAVLLLTLLLAACTGKQGGNKKPTELVPTIPVTDSPQIRKDEESAPGNISDVTLAPEKNQREPTDTEEAGALREAATGMDKVSKAAVLVTNDGKAVVALILRSGATLDDELENKIAGAAYSNTKVHITADVSLYEQTERIEKRINIGETVASEEIEAIWDKIE